MPPDHVARLRAALAAAGFPHRPLPTLDDGSEANDGCGEPPLVVGDLVQLATGWDDPASCGDARKGSLVSGQVAAVQAIDDSAMPIAVNNWCAV